MQFCKVDFDFINVEKTTFCVLHFFSYSITASDGSEEYTTGRGITSLYHDATGFQKNKGEVCNKAKISITPSSITLLTVGCPPR